MVSFFIALYPSMPDGLLKRLPATVRALDLPTALDMFEHYDKAAITSITSQGNGTQQFWFASEKGV